MLVGLFKKLIYNFTYFMFILLTSHQDCRIYCMSLEVILKSYFYRLQIILERLNKLENSIKCNRFLVIVRICSL